MSVSLEKEMRPEEELPRAAEKQDWVRVFEILDSPEVNTALYINRPMKGEQFQPRTLLFNALLQGRTHAMEGLRKRGATIEGKATNNDYVNWIDAAFTGKSMNALRWLNKQGYDLSAPFAKNHDEECPIHKAARELWVEAVEYLLTLDGISANQPTKTKKTPVMSLVGKKGIEVRRIMDALKDAGANLNARDDSGEDIMSKALASSASGEVVEVLSDFGIACDGDKTLRKAFSALFQGGFEAVADAVAKSKRLPSPPSSSGTALGYGVSQPFNKSDLFREKRTLTGRGEPVVYTPLDNPRTWLKAKEYFKAAREAGSPITMKDLLRENGEGKTYLQRAIECGQGHVVLRELMVEQGEDFDVDLLSTQGPLGNVTGMSELGEAVWAHHLMRKLFGKKDVWENRGLSALEDFRLALPKELQADFSNYPVLREEISDAEKPGKDKDTGGKRPPLLGRIKHSRNRPQGEDGPSAGVGF